jgi:hypothetical protein
MKTENFQLRSNNQRAREHFSYSAAAHPRSLEGTLNTNNARGTTTVAARSKA